MSDLTVKHIFGIDSSLKHSVIYVDEHCYLYPSSRHLIFYDTDYRYQYVINYGSESDHLQCLSLSPNKEYLLVGLKNIDKCRLILYELSHLNHIDVRRRKILPLIHSIRSNQILSLVFSSDSKYVLSLQFVSKLRSSLNKILKHLFINVFCSDVPDLCVICWSIEQIKSIGIIYLQLNLNHYPFNLQVRYRSFSFFCFCFEILLIF